MAERSFKFPWRILVSLVTFALVGWVVYQNWDGFVETFENLNRANIFVILLLIPEQLLMYYACGQIFFSYLEAKLKKVFLPREKMWIATELNFVNRAVPAGGVGGLAYLTYRLKPFGVTVGQASFLYIFRYAVTTVINYFQALIAILILLALNGIPEEAMWLIPVSLLMNVGFLAGLVVIIAVAGAKKRPKWLKNQKVLEYLDDVRECIKVVKKDKRSLVKPTLWGFLYSFCEVGVYWIVAAAMGRPDMLPVIMVGEAIGSVFDGLVPYGPYELGMVGVMGLLLGGTAEAMAISTITVVMARALSLIFTIATGYWPYNQVIRGKK